MITTKQPFTGTKSATKKNKEKESRSNVQKHIKRSFVFQHNKICVMLSRQYMCRSIGNIFFKRLFWKHFTLIKCLVGTAIDTNKTKCAVHSVWLQILTLQIIFVNSISASVHRSTDDSNFDEWEQQKNFSNGKNRIPNNQRCIRAHTKFVVLLFFSFDAL